MQRSYASRPPAEGLRIVAVMVAVNTEELQYGFDSRLELLAHADTEDAEDPDPVRAACDIVSYVPSFDFIGRGLQARAVHIETLVFEGMGFRLWREVLSKPNLLLRVNGDVFDLEGEQLQQLRVYLEYLSLRSRVGPRFRSDQTGAAVG